MPRPMIVDVPCPILVIIPAQGNAQPCGDVLMGSAEILDIAKGFGASAPMIGLLLYLLMSERKKNDKLQEENMEMLRQSVTLAVSLKSLLERVVVKIGA